MAERLTIAALLIDDALQDVVDPAARRRLQDIRDELNAHAEEWLAGYASRKHTPPFRATVHKAVMNMATALEPRELYDVVHRRQERSRVVV